MLTFVDKFHRQGLRSTMGSVYNRQGFTKIDRAGKENAMAYRIGIITADQGETHMLTTSVFPAETASGELIIREGRPSNIAAVAAKMVAEGAQALIARGGNYFELNKVFHEVPLMEIGVTAQDVLATLGEAVGRYRTIWLILSKYVRFDYESCRSILPENIHYYQFEKLEELEPYIAALPDAENTLIIGSGFVRAPARAKGCDSLQIYNSAGTLREIHFATIRMLQARDAEAARTQQLAAILSNIEDGVLTLDEKYCVVQCNSKAEEMLSTTIERLRGQELTKLIPEFAPFRIAFRQKTADERLLHVSARALVVRTAPVVPEKGTDAATRILLTMRDVTRLQELERNLRFQLSKKGMTAKYHFEDILTHEPAMQNLIARGKQCAQSDNTVMIYGDSGTGKELFAQSIHNASPRKDYPFVAVNCAALTENLLESELFGYVSGAFTGARKEGKAGLFELAHRGTIFLDEINSMSLNTQAKILRVIEQKEVMRLGSDYIIPLDVRIITAANENLARMVRQNTFRRDLFFRLNVLELRIPTLNERKRDIPYLFRQFTAELSGTDLSQVEISPELEAQLLSHNWWGNVRELRNVAQRYAALGCVPDPNVLFPESYTEEHPELIDDTMQLDLRELNRTVETLVIQSLFHRGLNKTQTAKVLGISRTALFKKLEQQKNIPDDAAEDSTP